MTTTAGTAAAFPASSTQAGTLETRTASPPSRRGCFASHATLRTSAFVAPERETSGAYGWPLRPFNRQHPVRAHFNDPRQAPGSELFHFGIDISAPDGAAVYAVEGGTAYHENGRAVSVRAADGRVFSYWHIVPAVRHHSVVAKHQLLGRIEAPWAHVHFAESVDGEYVNPLRPGALAPYGDRLAPTVADLRFFHHERPVHFARVAGVVDLQVDAFDTVPMPVARPWAAMPVTPVLVRWRVLRGRAPVTRWQTAVDFRAGRLPGDLFDDVYGPMTRQNHPNHPGRYCMYLVRGWDTRRLRDGRYRVQVTAADTRSNLATASVAFTVANRAH